MGFICDKCSTSETLMDFPTGRDLDSHIKSGHKTKPEGWQPKIKRIKLEDIPKGAPLPLQSPEAISIVVDKPKETPKPTPLQLVYKFTGQCDTCLSEPDTIVVEMGTRNSYIAYCVSCKKQLKEIKAIPIDKQK